MKANYISLTRTTGLIAATLLGVAATRAAESDAFPTFDGNYIKISGAGFSASGSGAAAQARTQTAKSGAGGIEEFNYGYDVSKDVNLQVNGKVMPGDSDYLLNFKTTKNEVGSFEAGYQRFRTFYDGSGGFFPTNNAWFPIYRQADYVDRGKFSATAIVSLPKAPVFTFKYTNETRTGTKPSTIWGDSDLTGIPIMVGPGASNPISADRKILPAYIHLGERLETWEASMKHTVGNTTIDLVFVGDRINNRDWRSIDRYVGELKPYPAFTSTTLVAAPQNLTQSPVRGFDVQGFRENGTSFTGKVETVINDKVTVFAGLNYRRAKEGIDASRILNTPLATATGVVTPIAGYASGGRATFSYNSNGDMSTDVVTGNAGVRLTPLPALAVEAAIKGEQYKDHGSNSANGVANLVNLATGGITAYSSSVPQSFDNQEKPWTPAVDVRYSGIKTVSLYGSWEYRNTKQDEQTTYTSFSTGVAVPSLVTENIKEKHQNLSVGANWTPVSFFSGRAEFFTKGHENNFTGYGTSAGAYYTLNYDIYGTKLTGTFKPIAGVAVTARYINQRGKASTVEDGFQQGDTNDSRRQTLSGTVDWNPSKTVYVQVNGSVVYDSITSAYPYISGTAKDVLRHAENNYYNGDATVGFALDKETDLQLQGTVYHAANFNPAQAYATLPLGASADEYTLCAGVKYKVDAKTVVNAKVGYIDSKNDTTGGFTNFRGPMAYVSVVRAF